MPEPFTLPSLRHPQVKPKGRWETRLDAFLMRAVLEPRPWWVAICHWLIRKLAQLTLYFGRRFPYILRPWYALAWTLRKAWLDRVHFHTSKTMFARRLFGIQWREGQFRPSYAIANWIVFVVFLWYVPLTVLEGLYVYGTYPFGTYHDFIVTQAYPSAAASYVTDQKIYAVHGYVLADNSERREYYLELGPNIWFMELYPEYIYGKVTVNGRCTFHTYGIPLRIPRGLRLLAAGSIWALNPWIVDVHCTPPTVVPPSETR